ncbi:arylsulfatase A family protein [Bifidobacteriaceae bacterium MCC01971]|nr:arylsulfatase A family protein [Bifidobacteriaceae bacterium MCC01971]
MSSDMTHDSRSDTETGTSRPNFLIVMTDDQGPWALTRTMPELVTPTVDELVETGTIFDNFYCASPVCSPARASLLTGRMPSAHGVHDWLIPGEEQPDPHEEEYLGGLLTLPEVLHEAGYVCAMSGKWHVGTSRRPAPGFDFWYAHRKGGGPYFDAPIWDDHGNKRDEPRYFTDAVADEACRFLDDYASGNVAGRTTSNSPFYMQVNFTAPHHPWVGSHPQELCDLYSGCDFASVPREPPHPWSKPRTEFYEAFEDPVPQLRGYAASLSGVDRALRLLLDKLDEHDLASDTVIVYMADNGFSCGHHGIWGKGNGTYPLNFWENSVRVPFIIRLPAQTEAHEVSDHVSATGFMSTICELAGVDLADDPLRAGSSFANLARSGVDDAKHESVMVFDEYGGGRMVRSGDYKLIERYDGPGELYHLGNDPEERENLYGTATHAHMQNELHDRLREWFAHHETAADSAWAHDVQGWGQLVPLRRGYDDKHMYVHGLHLR